MSENDDVATSLCLRCGYDAPSGTESWDRIEHPPLGTLTRCPECGSTDVTNRS